MGGCLTSLAAGCACTTCCCISTSGNTSSWKVGKVICFLFHVYTVLWLLIMRVTKPYNWLTSLSGINDCDQSHPKALNEEMWETCYKNQLGYRLGTSAAVVFLVHFLFTIFGAKCGTSSIDSFWILKFLAVPGLGAIFLLVPNSFFDTLMDVFQVGLIVFVILQCVAFIDFGYSWNDLWTGNALEDQNNDRRNEKAGRKWYIGIFAVSAVMLLVAWIGYIFMFIAAETGREDWILAITLIVSVVLLALSITDWASHGALLPSAVVNVFLAWLAWSTLMSDPEYYTLHNSGSDHNGVTPARLVISLVLAAVSLFYVSVNAKDSPLNTHDMSEDESLAPANEPNQGNALNDLANLNPSAEQANVKPNQEERTDVETGRRGESEAQAEGVQAPPPWTMVAYFNTLNLAASMYLTIQCSLWLAPPTVKSDNISFWVLAAAQWVLLGLYLWTLVAPQLFKSRFQSA